MPGPPWFAVPNQWVFDGHRMQLNVPPTKDLVQALLIDNEACGMYILTATMNQFDAMWMYARIFEPELPLVQFDLLDEIADTLMGVVFGIPRWTATAIWKETLGAWPMIDGELQGRGVNVMDLPPHSATNAVIGVWRTFYAGGDGFGKWWDKMCREPARVLMRQLDDENDETAATDFAAVMALSQGVKAAPRVADSEVVDQIPDTLQ